MLLKRFCPYLNALVAYKSRCYFMACGKVGERYGIDSWATGVANVRGAEGTWRDAVDGALGRNPIAHGSVDGTIALHVDVPPGGTEVVHHWLCAAVGYFEAEALEKLVRERGPEPLEQRSRDYWRLWANQEARDFGGLSDELVELYKRSLLVIRTQIDNRGAIIAANDSDITEYARDTYSYMWPRDGALVAMALDRAGYHEVAQRFFTFCQQIVSPEGFFFHKYTPFGALGSSWHPWIDVQGRPQLPIQEDETALVLVALWHHFQHTRDVEVIRPFYRPLIRGGADFLVGFRDPRTGLPTPSWDLWEERRGVHAWTVGAVWGGLQAAAEFTQVFGDTALSERYRDAAAEIKAAARAYLYDPAQARFTRTLILRDEGFERDTTLDSSISGLFLFGMFEPHDPMLARTMAQLRERLGVKTAVGGVARYEGDSYQQVSRDLAQVPGNPWFICTLWLADYDIATAERLEDLAGPLEVLEWVRCHALPSGVLAEQVHPYSGAPVSVSPLTWSHAAFVNTIHLYLDKRRLLLRARLHQGLQSDDALLEALRSVAPERQ
ncbi:MAG: glycoside hydrolase family 15 protein [Chloroflexi bacterium]|nr:glycoside hydrolase family 15 protein [Chloroflexota bacterium]